MGFVRSVPVSSKENDMAWTNRGGGAGKRIKPFWGAVLWDVFPSPEFSTPLCHSLREHGSPESVYLADMPLDSQTGQIANR